MIALRDLTLGLLIAHAACAYFFICGSMLYVFKRRELSTREGSVNPLITVVLTIASGMAITGFATFLAGLLHLIYPVTALAWLCCMAIFFALRGDSPLRADFWVARAALWKSAFASPFALGLYALVLALSVPAYIPDTGSDATSYHVAYAFDWATSHYLNVDPWLRLPYYANNWLLLDTWMIEFGQINAIAFLTWLSGALSVILTYAAIVEFAPQPRARSAATQFVAVVGALAIAICPVFLAWLYNGMIDVQIGFFFLVFVVAVTALSKYRSRTVLLVAIICGSFLVGMKVSLIALLPLVVFGVSAALCSGAVTKRVVAIAALTIVVLSSPWYVKNFIQAGDPIAPTLNLALHGVDSKWSKADMKDVLGDLRTDASPAALLRMPLAVILTPNARAYRALGITLLIAAIFVPGLIIGLSLTNAMRVPIELQLAAAAVVYAIAYWNLTSNLTRYALLFYAALAVVVGISLLHLSKRRWQWAALPVAILLALPAPASAAWYRSLWYNDYVYQWTWYKGHDVWMEPRCAAYRQMQYIVDRFAKRGRKDLVVYGVQTNYMTLYFKENGVTEIGDQFGPERAVDFAYAIRTHTLGTYIARFNIGAFLVPAAASLAVSARGLDYDDLHMLDQETAALGYVRKDFPDNRYVVYLSPLAQ